MSGEREGETEVPGSVGVRDVCCRKFRGQKPKIESDVETHPSLIYKAILHGLFMGYVY